MSRSGLFSTESDLDTSPPAAAAPSPDLSNTPPLPAFSLSDKEKDNQLSILLRLLQRASRSPEEMIEGALELSLVGLLSRGVLEGLCKSVGLGDAQSASVLGLQSQHALALTQMQRVASRGGRRRSFRMPPGRSLSYGTRAGTRCVGHHRARRCWRRCDDLSCHLMAPDDV